MRDFLFIFVKNNHNMKFHFFTTDSKEADKYLHDTLLTLENSEITVKDAIFNLNNAQWIEGCDMTKEVVQEYIEHVINISGESEDYIWSLYDLVFSPKILITDGKDYSILNVEDKEVFASTLDSLLTNLKLDRTSLIGLQDKDLVIITNIEDGLVRVAQW